MLVVEEVEEVASESTSMSKVEVVRDAMLVVRCWSGGAGCFDCRWRRKFAVCVVDRQ